MQVPWVTIAATAAATAPWLLAVGVVYLRRRPARPKPGPPTLDLGPEPPAVANFLYADTGGDARTVFDALLREGVIVRPLNAFGSETAVRVTVGTPEENAFLAAALERVVARATN